MDAKIKGLLEQPLDKSKVSERQKNGISLAYLEGHHVIREANRIFGFDGWSYELSSLNLTECGKNTNGNIIISAQAVVAVLALGQSRQDVGYGSGIAKSMDAAREGAGKEAVTDALKRALRTFGDQFGNALYDKAQKHVADPIMEQIQTAAGDNDALHAIWNSLTPDQKNQYAAAITAAKAKE